MTDARLRAALEDCMTALLHARVRLSPSRDEWARCTAAHTNAKAALAPPVAPTPQGREPRGCPTPGACSCVAPDASPGPVWREAANTLIVKDGPAPDAGSGVAGEGSQAREVAAELMRFVRRAQGMTHDERAWYVEGVTPIIATALAAAGRERERATWIAAAKHRCIGCRDGVGFVSNEHGALRPRGHVTTGIVGVNYGYCAANWELDQAAALPLDPEAAS